MKNRLMIILILVSGLWHRTIAQEVITGLYENPVIREAYEKIVSSGSNRGIEQEHNPVLLPFFDDFNQSWIYPDQRRWADEEAYVNANFGYRSANVGVATLDALNQQGKLHANASQFPFLADSLTSRPIRLDSIFSPQPRSIAVADSIYLSFFYQPQGRANKPESTDSLILQFGYYTGDSVFANYFDSIWVEVSLYIQPDDTIYPGDTVFAPATCNDNLFVIADDYYFYNDLIRMPCDSVMIPEFKWKRIWSTRGLSLQDFYDQYGTYSRQVMIPITDSARFFRNDFQFRFINFASLATESSPSWRSNCDQWNVDYIYLNLGRSYKDTVYTDVTFVERAPSMLKNYEAMPYNQYCFNPANELKDELDVVITNLDSTIYNSSYYYVVYQVDGPFQYLYPGGNCNLFPYNINGYQNCIACAAHACPPVNFVFPLTTADSAEFEIRHFIIGDITPTDTIGDTLSFRQRFFNYYAYDDGTPEEGYGLELDPSGARLAYRFSLNTKDTLRAIQMFFNRTQNDANEKYFNLMVWQDNNGKPGEVIYSQLNEKVEFSPNLLGFHTYMLDTPILVNGTFYIGWEQLSPDNLNLGYDRFNNAQQHIFYNTSGEWFQSINQGSLLMRPLLGGPFDPSSLEDVSKIEGQIIPYPNPLQGETIRFRCEGIYAQEAGRSQLTVEISNILGVIVYSGRFDPAITIPDWKPGVYIIRINGPEGRPLTQAKLIKK